MTPTTSGARFASALDAARAIVSGATTSAALVQGCLDRIAAREDAVGAWTHVAGLAAIAAAQRCDAQSPRSLLHGVPVGLKDVIDTADMPTCYGSPIYAGHRPAADAACVALLKAAGMIVLGKTVTTEFAHRLPAKTRNPVDLDCTPGGSSSGSAAAVADAMVPLAVGTQTGGSVIRPASYCGVVGYKPTFGTINRAGVKPLVESVDTIGVFARDVADAACLAAILAGHAAAEALEPARSLPTIGICRTRAWEAAGPDTRAAIHRARSRFARAGARVADFELPESFAELSAAYRVIQVYEGWRALAYERDVHGDRLSDSIWTAFKIGGETSRDAYVQALDLAAECRASFGERIRDYDVLLTPSAPGEAPRGLADIGDSVFNSLWTLLGLPCITLPAGVGVRGLPVGIQIVGPAHADLPMLRHALWAESVLKR